MGKEERSASMITVFHGGVDIIENPRTDKGRKNLDFGFGLYLLADACIVDDIIKELNKSK